MKKSNCLAALRFWLVRNIIWRLRRPRYITLLGGPGAGKGTVATALAPALNLTHLSTGALIRAEIAAGSDFGKQVKDLIEKGALAPDHLVMHILESALRLPENSRGVILDGFPRTLNQARMLDDLLKRWGVQLEKAVWLELSESDLIERLSLRRTCTSQSCGRSYHLTFEPPAVADKCDGCGSPLYQRKDDVPEAISTRLHTYREESRPLRQYYERSTARGVLAFLNPTNAMNKGEVLALVIAALETPRA
jgi:adenylate kinase